MINNIFYKSAISLLSPPGKNAKLTTLIYHRVIPESDALFPSTTTTERFNNELTTLKSVFNVLPLSEAISHLKKGTLPARAACITFDDGYADNAEFATPLLKKHNLIATFFIATDYLNGGRMFNDTIIESIRRSPLKQIDLSAIGLNVLPITTNSEKTATIEKTILHLKYLPAHERVDKAAQVAELSQYQGELPNNLMMTTEQLVAMRKAGMEIGCHTASHPILANLSREDAYDDIAAGKQFLEDLLKEKMTLFAYPNGKLGADYKAEQTAIIRELGFQGAVSTTFGAGSRKSDLFQLPRFTPWGDMNKFIPLLMRNLIH